TSPATSVAIRRSRLRTSSPPRSTSAWRNWLRHHPTPPGSARRPGSCASPDPGPQLQPGARERRPMALRDDLRKRRAGEPGASATGCGNSIVMLFAERFSLREAINGSEEAQRKRNTAKRQRNERESNQTVLRSKCIRTESDLDPHARPTDRNDT